MKNRNNINNSIDKILIIRLSSIGDIVLTTHLVRNLRISYPRAHIDFICFSEYNDLLIENKRISTLHTISKKFLKASTKRELTEYFIKNDINNYNIIIDLHKNKYSRKIRKSISKISHENKPQIYKVDKLRMHKLSLVFFKKPLLKDFQIPDIYFKAVRDLSLKDDGKGLEVWLPNESEYLINSKTKKENKQFKIAIAPGAAHFTKRYPQEKFREILQFINTKYKAQFILLGGSNDEKICNYLEQSIENNIINYCSKTSLLQTTQIINECDLLLTNDTGIMHIAAARQVPIVAIFGSSVKELGFTPYRSPNQIIEHKVWCRPCSHIGRESCPLGHFKCMNEIETPEVIQAILTFLNNNKSGSEKQLQ